MKYLLTILFLLLFSYIQAFEVTVYGRNNCGFTQSLRNELATNNVAYTYCNIDSAGCLGQLYSVAIEFNLAVNGVISLPVVLVVVDGKRYGYSRPSITTILKITSSLEIEDEKLFWPNPVIDIIYAKGEFEIYNMYGILILKSHNRHISIAALSQGIYFVRVNGKTTKIIKK